MKWHKELLSARRREAYKKNWYKFSRNPMSVAGLIIVAAAVFVALFADFISPYPKHAGLYVDFENASLFPSWEHLFGTDLIGRDILTRTFFGFRYSLTLGAVVLSVVVPVGVVLGLVAGYFNQTWIEIVIMRITDVFVGLPPLVLALAVCSVLTPNAVNAMLAVTAMWWPYYCRLTFGLSSSIRNEYFVRAAEVTGASVGHIIFKEILPNCLGSILTKMTLDMGWVILLGASLSYVGLGAQPPTADLGTMVSEGAQYLPGIWWMSIFPSIAIVIIILGFNLLGDGVRDLFGAEGV